MAGRFTPVNDIMLLKVLEKRSDMVILREKEYLAEKANTDAQIRKQEHLNLIERKKQEQKTKEKQELKKKNQKEKKEYNEKLRDSIRSKPKPKADPLKTMKQKLRKGKKGKGKR
jgi:hypothetical protein